MQDQSAQSPAYSEDEAWAIVRELRRAPEVFAALFAPESEDALHHRPAVGEWSAVEIVAHLADHDRFERTQRIAPILAEDSPAVPADETRFRVAEEHYQALSAAAALDFFKRERGLTVGLLEGLGPHEWIRTAIHPNDGESTLLRIADLRGHDHEHFAQASAAIASARR